jgi:ribosomal protein S27E
MSVRFRPQPDRRQEPDRRAPASGGRRSCDDLKLTLRFASAVVTVECRDCGRRTKVTVAQLDSGVEVQCDGCGTHLAVNGREVSSGLAQLAARIYDASTKRKNQVK